MRLLAVVGDEMGRSMAWTMPLLAFPYLKPPDQGGTVLMIGDHRGQLPPVTKNDFSTGTDEPSLADSLLQYIEASLTDEADRCAHIYTLKEAHRFGSGIATFLQRYTCYPDLCDCYRAGCPCHRKDAEEEARRRPFGAPLLLNLPDVGSAPTPEQTFVREALSPNSCMVLAVVNAKAENVDEATAYRHAEKETVVNLVAAAWRGGERSIRVVAPHHGPPHGRIPILEGLLKEGASMVDEREAFAAMCQQNVTTVDGSQGAEAKLVIFACCFHADSRPNRFTNEIRRLIVGLSRAERKVIFVTSRSFLHPPVAILGLRECDAAHKLLLNMDEHFPPQEPDAHGWVRLEHTADGTPTLTNYFPNLGGCAGGTSSPSAPPPDIACRA